MNVTNMNSYLSKNQIYIAMCLSYVHICMHNIHMYYTTALDVGKFQVIAMLLHIYQAHKLSSYSRDLVII